MAVDIDSLQIEIEATSNDAAQKIEQLSTALTKLKASAKGGAGLTTTTKQLQALADAAKLINRTNINSKRIQRFAAAMNRLSNIQKAIGLSSTINALRKIPDISSSLEKADLGKFATQMNQVANAVRPLATEMQKVSNGFSAFPVKIQRIIQSNSSLVSSNNAASKSFGVLGTGIRSSFARFGIYTVAIRRIASVMSNWVQESNDYVENLNLFTVAMGEYAEEAKAYAEEVQAVMGIDSSEWMRNQGVFMQMATGFGVASDSAALMSKNLTQLGYDISSFYNISIEDAMQKLQSGIAGEIEPLRRLGYAIDVATLQQVAYEHGIQQSVNTMSQAEKSQLRYVAIMEQSGNVMQDLSRTLQTPANAMRILNQQITQLSRALGNLLIPFLQIVIPYVQAFVVVLTEAIQAIANLVGFTLPEIDYSGLDGVTSGATDAEEALGGAAAAAEDLKKATLGIDELNVISPIDAGGAGGGVDVGGGDLGLELPEYDFLGDAINEKVDGIADSIREKLEPLFDFLEKNADIVLDSLKAIGAALATWKISKPVIKWFRDLKNNKLSTGITLALTGAYLSFDGWKGIINGSADLWDYIKTAIGTALLGTGAGLIASLAGATALTAIAIGFAVALVGTIISIGLAKSQGISDESMQIYNSSELAEWVNGVREEIEKNTEIVVDIPVSLNAKVENIQSIENEYAAIEELITKAFDLSDIEFKTSDEMNLLVGYIDTINDMNLEGIRLEYNEFGQIVNTTKEEVLGLVESMKEQAKAEAYHDLLVEAYKDEAEAIESISELQSINSELTSKQNEKLKELYELSGRTNTTLEEFKTILDTSNDSLVLRTTGLKDNRTEAELLLAGYRDLSTAIDENKTALDQANTALGDAKEKAKLAEIGMQNLGTSIEDLAPIAENAVSDVNNEFSNLKTDYEIKFTANVAAVQGALAGLLPSIRSTTYPNGYATGGFPESGQLFFANEGSAPELIGNMGRRTAVANTSQIVEGITYGVENANAQQNALLREQNDLLRAILAKSGTVRIGNKDIKNAYDTASRQSGATILSGGVV